MYYSRQQVTVAIDSGVGKKEVSIANHYIGNARVFNKYDFHFALGKKREDIFISCSDNEALRIPSLEKVLSSNQLIYVNLREY